MTAVGSAVGSYVASVEGAGVGSDVVPCVGSVVGRFVGGDTGLVGTVTTVGVLTVGVEMTDGVEMVGVEMVGVEMTDGVLTVGTEIVGVAGDDGELMVGDEGASGTETDEGDVTVVVVVTAVKVVGTELSTAIDGAESVEAPPDAPVDLVVPPETGAGVGVGWLVTASGEGMTPDEASPRADLLSGLPAFCTGISVVSCPILVGLEVTPVTACGMPRLVGAAVGSDASLWPRAKREDLAFGLADFCTGISSVSCPRLVGEEVTSETA